MNRSIPRLVVVSLFASLTGCSLASDHFSCGIKLNGALVRCVDYTDVGIQYRATVEALCRTFMGDFTIDTQCTDTDKVGGCREEGNGYKSTAWYYTASDANTPAAVAGRCSGKSEFVDKNGVGEATSDLGQPGDMAVGPRADFAGQTCSGPGVSAVTITFQNMSAQPVSGYWVDTACAERYYFTINPNGSYNQPTFASHVWRVRAGSMDGAGAVVKEYVADAAQFQTVVIK